jgi:MOSC domain-containing protein YiiM
VAGQVEAIWIKRAHRGPMDAVARAEVRAGSGLLGNADQGGKRQVTVIAQEAWEAMTAELGANVPPSARRANLLVSGVDLANSRGRVLKIGPVRLKVWGETRPCELMEQAHPGLQAAMRPGWRGGVFGEILDDGAVAVGAEVRWEPEPPPLGT